MKMKSRTAAIMEAIIHTDKGLPMVTIREQYKISNRTLYNDIYRIKAWLMQNQLGTLRITKQSLFIDTLHKEGIERKIKIGLYYFSSKQRQVFVFYFLALASEPVFLSTLEKYFHISKSATVIDLGNVKEYMRKEGISLQLLMREGYMLEGQEWNIRHMLEIYYDDLDFAYTNVVYELKKLLQVFLTKLSGESFDFFQLAYDIVKDFEHAMHYEFKKELIKLLCFMIVSSWIRSMQGKAVALNEKNKGQLKNSKPYKVVAKYHNCLRIKGLRIPKHEDYYITILLMAVQRKQINK